MTDVILKYLNKTNKYYNYFFSFFIACCFMAPNAFADPLARVEPLTDVRVGQVLILDGGNSINSSGLPLKYQWLLLAVPAGSASQLAGNDGLQSQLPLDVPGMYRIQLAVTDSSGASDTAILTVSAETSGPVARPLADRRTTIGTTVQLDGSASYDLDGAIAAYQWSLESIPDGSQAVISDPSAVTATFIADVDGTYVIGLTVFDDDGASSSKSTITIATNSTPPIADAGPDQSVRIGETAVLEPFASTDADGDRLTSSWSLLSSPTGSTAVLGGITLGRVDLTPDIAGFYVVQLAVNDGHTTAYDTLVVSADANVRPVADAGPDIASASGATVTLDGSRSTDWDGDPLTYHWAIVSAPTGSAATLSDPASPRPQITVDQAGEYELALQVSDGTVNSRFDTVIISTEGVSPIADAGPDQVLDGQLSAQLDGTGSSDPDGDPITALWSIIGLGNEPYDLFGEISTPDAFTTAVQFLIDGSEIDADGPIALLQKFNAISIHKMQSRSSVAGSTYVGDDVHPKNAHYGADLAAGSDALVVFGDAKHGDIFVDGPADIRVGGKIKADIHLSGGDLYTDIALDPLAVRSRLEGFAAGLSELVSNSTVEGSAAATGTVTFVAAPDEQGIAVFEISNANDLFHRCREPDSGSSCTTTLALDANDARVIVINVGGHSAQIDRIQFVSQFTDPAIYEHVIWNFFEANRVNVKDAFYGSILAPNAHVKNTATVSGSIAAGRLFHWAPITGRVFDPNGPIIDSNINPVDLAVLQLQVSDGTHVDYDTVVVSTGNLAPVAVPTGPGQVLVADPVTLDGTASFDPNNDGLTYSWSLLFKPAGSQSIITNPTSAAATIVPDMRGFYIAQLIVSDGTLTSEARTVLFEATNTDPVISSVPVTGGAVGENYRYDVEASDADGDTLTYTLTAAPAGMTINDATGVIDWTPAASGAYSVSVQVEDGRGGVATQSFEVVVEDGANVNSPPVLSAIGDQTVKVGETFQLTLSGSDPDGDEIAFFVLPLPLPEGAQFDAATNTFHFLPTRSGSYDLTFLVSDGIDQTVETVSITVEEGDPADPTSISGAIYDATDLSAGTQTPVVGATVSYGGVTTTSAADGTFTLQNVQPGSGTLIVDGQTATPAAGSTGYGDSQVSLRAYVGVDNILPNPITLARLGDTSPTIDPTIENTITFPGTGVTITVPPNSATNTSDGTPYTGTLTLSEFPLARQYPSPVGSCSAYQLDPPGVSFDPPATLTLPNRDNLPADSKALIWAWDAARNAYVKSGLGIVSADGATISIISGGLSNSTSFMVTPLQLGAVATNDQPNERYVPSALGDGNLREAFALANYQSVGDQRGISMLHNSVTAAPAPIISAQLTLPVSATIPEKFIVELEVGGVKIPGEAVAQTLYKPTASRPDLSEDAVETITVGISFDARLFPTGRYDYKMLLYAGYSCSVVAAEQRGEIYVNNRSDSPYGDGWKITELQSLTVEPDGSVLLEEPDGTLKHFAAEKPIAGFDKASFDTPADNPNNLAIADFNEDGRPDIAMMEAPGHVAVLLNDGQGGFSRRSAVPMGRPFTNPINWSDPGFGYATDVTDVIAADLNEDRIPDLVATRQFSSTLVLAYGRGNGTFEPAAELANTRDSFSVAAADFNNDAITDLAIYEGSRLGAIIGAPHVYLNDGNGAITEAPGSGAPVSGSRILAGDFNGDGQAEAVLDQHLMLYTLDRATGDYNWKYHGGTCSKTPPRQQRRIDSTDLNGDGTADFAVVCDDEIAIYHSGRDFPKYTVAQTIPFAGLPSKIGALVFIDLNGDGNQDLVFDPEVRTDTSYYFATNQGDGTFAAPQAMPGTAITLEVDFHDMDGDGLRDMVVLSHDRVIVNYARAGTGGLRSPAGDFTGLALDASGNYVRTYKDGTVVVFNAEGRQVSTTDPNGNQTQYTYDADGRVTSITDPAGLVTTFTYSGGRLASTTTPDGRTTLFEYDARGELIKYDEPDITSVQYAYDSDGRLTGVTDQRGHTTTYSYGAGGRHTGTTYPDGASVSLNVAATLGLSELGGATDGQYVREEDRHSVYEDANGNRSHVLVNEFGTPLWSRDPLKRLTLYRRDPDNLVTAVETPSDVSTLVPSQIYADVFNQLAVVLDGASQTRLDNPSSMFARLWQVLIAPAHAQLASSLPHVMRTELDYDDNGNVVAMREIADDGSFAAFNGLQRETLYEYEPDHNRLIRKQVALRYYISAYQYAETTYDYDADGNLIKMTDPVGSVTTHTYDSAGLRLTTTDPNGNTTTFTYDALGRLEIVTDALGTRYRYVRDSRGNVLLRIDAEGLPEERRVSFTYDALNRMLTSMNGEGELTVHSYDAAGNPFSVEDPTGVRFIRTFDSRNRVSAVQDPARGKVALEFDGNSNTTAITDPEGNRTALEYDAADRLVRTVDALGDERRAAYDVRDNVISVAAAHGRTTTYAMDIFDRVVTRTNPLGHAATFKFDLADRKTRFTPPITARAVAARYDDAGRLTDTVRNSIHQRDYTYDAAHNLLTADTYYFKEAFTYDALHRPTRAASTNRNAYLDYTYDALGRRTSMTDEFGAETLYEWDKADRLTAVTTPAGKRIEFDRDPAGRRSALRLPNGLETRYAYDARPGVPGGTGRLASIAHGIESATGSQATALGTALGTFTYNYDNRGDITQIAEPARARNFNYDAMARLVGVTDGAGAALETYTLDEEGNRVTSHLSSANVTDANDRLIETETHVFSYDDNGYLRERTDKATGRVWRFTYDLYGNIDTAKLHADATTTSALRSISYRTDALNRRTFARGYINDRSEPSYLQRFYYDGFEAARIDESSTLGALRARNWQTYSAVIDDLLAITPKAATGDGPGSASYYAHTDHQGSIRALTDDAATIANQYDYDSYGNRLASVESLPQPFGYTGRRIARSTGLYYYRHRDYDPKTGRFLQEDPLYFGAGDHNLYRYTWNNPVNWVDPSGLNAAGEEATMSRISLSSAVAVAEAGARVACVFDGIADGFRILNSEEYHAGEIALLAVDLAMCVGVKRPRMKRGQTCDPRKRGLLGSLIGTVLAVGGALDAPHFLFGLVNSFQTGTPIRTRDGLMPIEDVAVGAQVLAVDTETGAQSWQRVTGRSSRTAKTALRLTVRDSNGKSETITVTAGHPYLVQMEDAGLDWRDAVELMPGDVVASAKGGTLTVTAITRIDAPVRVHNFEIAGLHNYAVGELAAWVHNLTLMKDSTRRWLTALFFAGHFCSRDPVDYTVQGFPPQLKKLMEIRIRIPNIKRKYTQRPRKKQK